MPWKRMPAATTPFPTSSRSMPCGTIQPVIHTRKTDTSERSVDDNTANDSDDDGNGMANGNDNDKDDVDDGNGTVMQLFSLVASSRTVELPVIPMVSTRVSTCFSNNSPSKNCTPIKGCTRCLS